jgi:hypothetical protein
MKRRANWCHYFNVFYLYVVKSLHVSDNVQSTRPERYGY